MRFDAIVMALLIVFGFVEVLCAILILTGDWGAWGMQDDEERGEHSRHAQKAGASGDTMGVGGFKEER